MTTKEFIDALPQIRKTEEILKALATLARCSIKDLPERLQSILDNIERMEKEKAELLKKIEEQK